MEDGLAEDAPMPLDLILQSMREHWREGRVEEAVNLAKAAAPYLHARAGVGRGAATLATMEDEQIDELCRRGLAGAPTASGDTE